MCVDSVYNSFGLAVMILVNKYSSDKNQQRSLKLDPIRCRSSGDFSYNDE